MKAAEMCILQKQENRKCNTGSLAKPNAPSKNETARSRGSYILSDCIKEATTAIRGEAQRTWTHLQPDTSLDGRRRMLVA